MDFIDSVVKYFGDNILFTTLFAIIFFILGAVFSSFLEPFGKKLYSFLIPPKVIIKTKFENRGYSLPQLKQVYTAGYFSIPKSVLIENNNYNYYIDITNASEIALNNISLTLEHDITFISNNEDDDDDIELKKKIYIDNLQVGQTASFSICNEQSLVKDTPIKITITLKESKKEIIQNKILSNKLERIWNF